MGERSPNSIPVGGRQSGGLVNSYKRVTKPILVAQLVEVSDFIDYVLTFVVLLEIVNWKKD